MALAWLGLREGGHETAAARRPSGGSRRDASVAIRADRLLEGQRNRLAPDARIWRFARAEPPAGSRLKTAVDTRRVLSERRRRFPQVRQDDEGGLRRETYRTAVGGDTGEHRQAAVEGDGR